MFPRFRDVIFKLSLVLDPFEMSFCCFSVVCFIVQQLCFQFLRACHHVDEKIAKIILSGGYSLDEPPESQNLHLKKYIPISWEKLYFNLKESIIYGTLFSQML